MESLRIVLLLVDPPLPFGKAMGRWYSVLLRGLRDRGHRVTALATCASDGEAEKAMALFPAPEFDLRCYRHATLPGLRGKLTTLRRPYSYPFSERLRADLRDELAKGYDLLHVETLWGGWLDVDPLRAVVSVPWLYQIDLADQPAGSWGERLRRRMTYRAERHLLRRYPNLIAVSPRLADRIREIAPRSEVHVLPFGLDLDGYPMVEERAEGFPPTIGLIASFDWTPGLTAGRRLIDRLWPEVKRRVPDARLHVAGGHARSVFREAIGRPDVTIDDWVSDVPAYFRQIDLQLYAPNDSSGMKFKVLESFGFGIPVVTNAAGVEGIPAVDGVHAGICEDDAGLIERTVALLNDPARRRRQRQAARALLESCCGPSPTLDRLEAIHRRVLALAGAPRSRPSLEASGPLARRVP